MDKFCRVTCLLELLKSNLCDKLRTNLCGSFILFPCLCLNNNCSTLFFILFSVKDPLLLLGIEFHASNSHEHLWPNHNKNKKFYELLSQPYFLPVL